jgi:hypothetical protein
LPWKKQNLWKKELNLTLQAIRTLNFGAQNDCYHFHPALELSGAGVAAPATGASESAAAAGWTGNGSSFIAQPVRTNRLAIERQAAIANRFIMEYESVPVRTAMPNQSTHFKTR